MISLYLPKINRITSLVYYRRLFLPSLQMTNLNLTILKMLPVELACFEKVYFQY